MDIASIVVGLTGAAASIAGLLVVLVQVPRATRAARQARDAVWAQESLATVAALVSQLGEVQAAVRAARWELALERIRLARMSVARLRGQPSIMETDEREEELQRASRRLGLIGREFEMALARSGSIDAVRTNELLGELIDALSTMGEQLRVEVGSRGDANGA